MTPDGASDGRELYNYPATAPDIALACKYSTGSNNVTVVAKLNAPEGTQVQLENGSPPTPGYEGQIEQRAPKATQGDLIFSLARAPADGQTAPPELPVGQYRWDLFFDEGSGLQFQMSVAFNIYK